MRSAGTPCAFQSSKASSSQGSAALAVEDGDGEPVLREAEPLGLVTNSQAQAIASFLK